MSKENVEIVRHLNAAINAGDMDGWLTYLDPEFEFVDHMAAVAEESGGIDTIRRQAEGWFETFPDFRAEVDEYIGAGDRVVTVTHWQGTGAGSGLPYSQRAAEIFKLRDGKIIELEMGFADKAAALRAMKLSA